jgi:hypothetical protein
MSPTVLVSYLGLVPALYALNWFWFVKICKGIAKVLLGEDDGSADGYTRDSKQE